MLTATAKIVYKISISYHPKVNFSPFVVQFATS